MTDRFFTVENCDRCNCKLISRKMSWFTEEALCMDCCEKEDELKKKLSDKGLDPAELEGCGYIPNI